MENVYFNELNKGIFLSYATEMFSENDLLALSKIIQENTLNLSDFVYDLLYRFSRQQILTKEIDWNIGSTIQHFEPLTVINAFKRIDKTQRTFLYDSIGLTWVFGEFALREPDVISYLYDVVKKSRNSEAWWRGAFSLERLGEEEAIILLKRSLMIEGVQPLNFYLDSLDDKKSIIGILLHSNNTDIKVDIYPVLKSAFLTSESKKELINCAWLLGRYKLIDKEIFTRMVNLIDSNDDYEVTYYTFTAIQEISSLSFLPTFKKFLTQDDPLLRKMAVRGVSYLDDSSIPVLLEDLLLNENHPSVISEISKGIYRAKNSKTRECFHLKNKYDNIENGLIIDESDKWYTDPSIYESFSLAEDPENLCFNLILKEVKKKISAVKNPIDLATGTGRAMRFFVDKIDYEGHFYAVDASQEMLTYLQKTIDRNHTYAFDIKLIESSLLDLSLEIKSNFIMSSFGFPSKINNRELSFLELEKVYNLLSDDGVFVTIGWDESFNDELNHFWFKYIPDSLGGYDYENWRKIKREKILSPRNSDLTWYKTGINVPLQFNNLKESAHVMGHLFGRDCAKFIVDNSKTQWEMSLGITLNTKDDLKKILKK